MNAKNILITISFLLIGLYSAPHYWLYLQSHAIERDDAKAAADIARYVRLSEEYGKEVYQEYLKARD